MSWIYSSRCFLTLGRRTQYRKLSAETILSNMAINLQLCCKYEIFLTHLRIDHTRLIHGRLLRGYPVPTNLWLVWGHLYRLTLLGAMPIWWRTTYISWHWGSYEYYFLMMEITPFYQSGRITLSCISSSWYPERHLCGWWPQRVYRPGIPDGYTVSQVSLTAGVFI